MEGLVAPGLASFWAGKRVFLTGHTGFKGGWLSLWLQHLGAEVAGYSLDPPSTPNLFHAGRVAEGMRSIHGDILNPAALQQAMQVFQPEIVFHLAAQSLVRTSYSSPIDTFATNVMGTANVLECLRNVASIQATVIVTSDKCYENVHTTRPYQESDPLGGHDPYSASKACAELVAASYRSSFLAQRGVAVATARAGNVIGGGDWAMDRLVPDVIRGFTAGDRVRIRHPHALRPWQHVLEPLHGYLVLAQALLEQGASFSSAWNFGPDPDGVRPVGWITEWLAHAWGQGAQWEKDDAQHVHEASLLTLDSSKAIAHLDWRPRLELPQALQVTLDWYRSFLQGHDARELCLGQIASYQAQLAP